MQLLKYLRMLWSYAPLIAITVDEQYGTYSTNLSNAILRFSLINLILGPHTFYLLTYSKGHKDQAANGFQFWYHLTLEKCLNMEEETLEKKTNIYLSEHLKSLEASTKREQEDCEKECLCYHIQSEQQRCDISYNKMSYYLGIVLVVIPLILPRFKISLLPSNGYLRLAGLFFLFALGYSLLNLVLFSIRFVKVAGIQKSRFSELKCHESDRTATQQLLSNYYFDWQSLCREARFRVSYVCNTQNWVVASIVFMIFLLCIQIISYPLEPANAVIG